MAEQIISPGVFYNENVPTVLEAAAAPIGAAIVGPTVLGPVGIPTVVTTYSEFLTKFGGAIVSGGIPHSYFTAISAQNYFKQGGTNLLVTRVANGSFTAATSSTVTNNSTVIAGVRATGSTTLAAAFTDGTEARITYSSTVYRFQASGLPLPPDDVDGNLYFFLTGSTATETATNLKNEINNALSGSLASSSNLFIANNAGAVISLSGSSTGTAFNGVTFSTGSGGFYATQFTLGGGVNQTGTGNAFVLKTISQGAIMNNSGTETSAGALASGSNYNLRWEISTVDSSSGIFTLLIRQGDDRTSDKNILETWRGVSLDPTREDYIAKVIGNQQFSTGLDGTDAYISINGEYPNRSKYVVVSNVNAPTPYYLDGAGNFKPEFTSSLPAVQSGSFGAATGDLFAIGEVKWNNDITANNTQGLIADNYTASLNLLRNKDQYAFNVISVPGLWYAAHSSTLNTLITNTTTRGDSILPLDLVAYGANTTDVVNQAVSVNSSYAAAYWPWLLVKDDNTGANVWCPASTIIPSVYVYNDNTSEAWFAPAGFTRGTMPNVVTPEKTLPRSLRDTLYNNKVNAIATFPGTGVVVYGQKTLQTVASALDRVNVRRLLITLKSYIGTVSQNLVFEPNSLQTRNSFLSVVNPYLETVQQNQGLYAFKVVMDASNNGPDVIDRNELRGAIYLQPVKTAEFIVLDFNILPTGAEFPA